VLWDRDWELEQIMDLPPRKARSLKRRLGIDDDYFRAVPGGAEKARLSEAAAYVRRLADKTSGDRESR
jgi:hypothetical protein